MSAEGVFIDPVRLVIRTKQPTETAKRLESKLEDLFSTSMLREMKGKKSKGSTRVARSKKTEAKKNDLKKNNRMNLEKLLTTNIDNYITRSVNDDDMTFKLPANPSDHNISPTLMKWPISVKWPVVRDSKHHHHVNDLSDGEMDPLLLLKYSLERINLPCGEIVFHNLFHVPCVQQYFICMFWFIKTKFFQYDCDNEIKYIMQLLSIEYVKIVEYLSQHAKAEANKDFIFQYLPYLLCNATFYGFFYLFPASRHMYSKGFRKTILLQIIQAMHGVQLCPVSVRVMWSKLFPEEMQDEDDGEETEQLIPMSLPIGGITVKKSGNSYDNEFTTGLSQGSTGVTSTKAPRTAKPGTIAHLDIDQEQNNDILHTGFTDETFQNIPMGKSYSTGDIGNFNGNTGTAIALDPLLRVTLKAPPAKSKYFVPRQRQEVSDMNDVSPCIQSYLDVCTSTGGKNPQNLYRTVPVNWCVSGGSDTHRRRQIPKELHDDLSLRSKAGPKEHRAQTIKSHKMKVKDSRLIEKKCNNVLSGGPLVVGRFSLDLVRKLKNTRNLGDIHIVEDSLAPAQPIRNLSDDDDLLDPLLSSNDNFE